MSRAARPDRRSAGRSGTSSPARIVETLAFKVIALMVISSMAILLWQFGIRLTGYAIGHAWPRETTPAVVTECSRALGMTGPCVVEVTGPSGDRSVALTDPGLFALAPGDEAPVVQKDDGTVGIGGWRPIADAALLVVLAIAFTTYAIGWWRKVLEHDTAPYDGGDPEDDPSRRHTGPPLPRDREDRPES